MAGVRASGRSPRGPGGPAQVDAGRQPPSRRRRRDPRAGGGARMDLSRRPLRRRALPRDRRGRLRHLRPVDPAAADRARAAVTGERAPAGRRAHGQRVRGASSGACSSPPALPWPSRRRPCSGAVAVGVLLLVRGRFQIVREHRSSMRGRRRGGAALPLALPAAAHPGLHDRAVQPRDQRRLRGLRALRRRTRLQPRPVGGGVRAAARRARRGGTGGGAARRAGRAPARPVEIAVAQRPRRGRSPWPPQR